MRQSQSSVLPETADKGKQPAGSPWLTGATGLTGVAVVAASVALMASAAPAHAHAHQASMQAHPFALVHAHSSALVKVRGS